MGDAMTTKKVQKSNKLNQANFSDFSLSCYRVLLNLISQIQRNDNNGNQLQLPVVARECTLSAKEYAEEFNLTGNTAYEVLKEATDKLMKTSFTLKTDIGILKINVCSQSHYVEKEGRIDIRFTEEIMPHLAALGQNFTMYNLKEISQFNSIYTTRIYELIMQFKTTGELDISIENLRHSLGCANIFVRYNDFKRYVISHAVNEINSFYKLDLEFEETKRGRKVERIKFNFKKTLIHLTYDPIKGKMRTQLSRPG
jgi:plasmid replication initiation protein